MYTSIYMNKYVYTHIYIDLHMLRERDLYILWQVALCARFCVHLCLCGEGDAVDGLIREFGKVAGNTKEDLDIGKDEETLYEND